MLELKRDGQVILISDHALERLDSRLRWPVILYEDIIKGICFSYWDKLLDSGASEFHIIKFGVEWVFAFRSFNTIVLKTVIPLKHHRRKNFHKKLFILATQYAKERSFLQQNKIKNQINVLLAVEGICIYIKYGRSVKRLVL